MILNSEFRTSQYINGFQLYGYTAGTINIQIVTSDLCGTTTPCAQYFSLYPFVATLNVLNSWTFNITTGNTILLLPQSFLAPKDSFIYLTQTGGVVALDSSGNATYSDMAVYYSSYYNLSSLNNQRLFIKPLSNFTTYQYSFSLTHTYPIAGLYNLNITFASSSVSYSYIANITQTKNLSLITWNSPTTLDTTLTASFSFYSLLKNETINVNFGDNFVQTLLITSRMLSFLF